MPSSQGGPRAAISVPPVEVSGAKMFSRALWRALLSCRRCQALQKSVPGVIEASSWPPLEAKNHDFAREGCKESTFSIFSFLLYSELHFWLILASLGSPKESKNRGRELSRRLLDRFWTPRRLQDLILEPKNRRKPPLEAYFGTHNHSLRLNFRHL